MSPPAARWGVGVPGSVGREAVAELAGLAECLGYDSFWFNCVGPDDDPADLLATAVAATGQIEIGIGVVPLAAYPPQVLAARLSARDVDAERIVLGVGSGAGVQRPLALVADGLAVLRAALPRTRLAVGGRGPRMVELAARDADALMLSMPSPAEMDRIAGQLAGSALTVHKYHRVAVGPGAADRLVEEMIANGVWPADGSRPARDELLGTAAGSASGAAGAVVDDLAGRPPAWRQVLRPLPSVPGDVSDLRRLLTHLHPPGR